MKKQVSKTGVGSLRPAGALWLIALFMLPVAGCVSSGTYEEMVRERDAALAEKSVVEVQKAELEAEKIVSRAHKRLSSLHSDISELKRQRMQLEMQIGSVIESHSKLLEMTKEENKAADENDPNLKFISQA